MKLLLFILPVFLFAGCWMKVDVNCIYPQTTWTIIVNTKNENPITNSKDFWLWCDEVFEWQCYLHKQDKIDAVYQKAEPKWEYSKILKNLWYKCNYIVDEQCAFYRKTAHYPKYEDTSMEEWIAHFYATYMEEWYWTRWCEWFCEDRRPSEYINNNDSCLQMCSAYFPN